MHVWLKQVIRNWLEIVGTKRIIRVNDFVLNVSDESAKWWSEVEISPLLLFLPLVLIILSVFFVPALRFISTAGDKFTVAAVVSLLLSCAVFFQTISSARLYAWLWLVHSVMNRNLRRRFLIKTPWICMKLIPHAVSK